VCVGGGGGGLDDYERIDLERPSVSSPLIDVMVDCARELKQRKI
jgi:hypothetical protein